MFSLTKRRFHGHPCRHFSSLRRFWWTLDLVAHSVHKAQTKLPQCHFCLEFPHVPAFLRFLDAWWSLGHASRVSALLYAQHPTLGIEMDFPRGAIVWAYLLAANATDKDNSIVIIFHSTMEALNPIYHTGLSSKRYFYGILWLLHPLFGSSIVTRHTSSLWWWSEVTLSPVIVGAVQGGIRGPHWPLTLVTSPSRPPQHLFLVCWWNISRIRFSNLDSIFSLENCINKLDRLRPWCSAWRKNILAASSILRHLWHR